MRNTFAQFSNIFGTRSTKDNWSLKFDPSLKKGSPFMCIEIIVLFCIFSGSFRNENTRHIQLVIYFFTRLLFAKDCLFYEVISCDLFQWVIYFSAVKLNNGYSQDDFYRRQIFKLFRIIYFANLIGIEKFRNIIIALCN